VSFTLRLFRRRRKKEHIRESITDVTIPAKQNERRKKRAKRFVGVAMTRDRDEVGN